MLTAFDPLGSPPISTVHITSTSPELWTHIAKQFLCVVFTSATSSSTSSSPPPFDKLHLQYCTRANAFSEVVRLNILNNPS